MSSILFHPATKLRVDECIHCPAHAIVLAGPAGTGKKSIARHVAAEILGIPVLKLSEYPYFRIVGPDDGAAISIETIRELKTFVSLKIPGSRPLARIILITDAHKMTTEAQNALLKVLEEPPADTMLILTVSHVEALLDTVRSRSRLITVTPPANEAVTEWFVGQEYDAAAVQKSIMLSGGLPGLVHALLTSEDDHPLFAATAQARSLLGGKTFDRLLMVDALSKQKQETADVLFILGQMARMSLLNATAGTDTDRWKRILAGTYHASELLGRNVQPKLVLTNLMLEL